MVALKEYEAYLKVKRFIEGSHGHDESEIILKLMNESNYVPLTIESDGTDPIKYYSTRIWNHLAIDLPIQWISEFLVKINHFYN